MKLFKLHNEWVREDPFKQQEDGTLLYFPRRFGQGYIVDSTEQELELRSLRKWNFWENFIVIFTFFPALILIIFWIRDPEMAIYLLYALFLYAIIVSLNKCRQSNKILRYSKLSEKKISEERYFYDFAARYHDKISHGELVFMVIILSLLILVLLIMIAVSVSKLEIFFLPFLIFILAYAVWMLLVAGTTMVRKQGA